MSHARGLVTRVPVGRGFLEAVADGVAWIANFDTPRLYGYEVGTLRKVAELDAGEPRTFRFVHAGMLLRGSPRGGGVAIDLGARRVAWKLDDAWTVFGVSTRSAVAWRQTTRPEIGLFELRTGAPGPIVRLLGGSVTSGVVVGDRAAVAVGERVIGIDLAEATRSWTTPIELGGATLVVRDGAAALERSVDDEAGDARLRRTSIDLATGVTTTTIHDGFEDDAVVRVVGDGELAIRRDSRWTHVALPSGLVRGERAVHADRVIVLVDSQLVSIELASVGGDRAGLELTGVASASDEATATVASVGSSGVMITHHPRHGRVVLMLRPNDPAVEPGDQLVFDEVAVTGPVVKVTRWHPAGAASAPPLNLVLPPPAAQEVLPSEPLPVAAIEEIAGFTLPALHTLAALVRDDAQRRRWDRCDVFLGAIDEPELDVLAPDGFRAFARSGTTVYGFVGHSILEVDLEDEADRAATWPSFDAWLLHVTAERHGLRRALEL